MLRSRCSPKRVTALFVVATVLLSEVGHAQRLSSEGIKELSDQISASITKEQKRKVGVIAFTELDGRTTTLGAFLAEELTTKLFIAGGFEIVERAQLTKVLAELKLAGSGAIDPDQAKQIGKLAGIDAIVTGSVTDLQSTIAVNCRVIDVQTGRVFGAAQTRIVKDDDIRVVMGKLSAPAVSNSAADAPPNPQADYGNAQALYNQGVIFWNGGRIADARRQFEAAVAASSNHAEAHYQLGMVLVNDGELAMAANEFETYLKLAPTGPNATQARALAAQLKR